MKSTKAQAVRWLSRLIHQEKIDIKKDHALKTYLFTVEGFCEENPVFFICRDEDGLQFGYHSMKKTDPSRHAPSMVKRQLIKWEALETSSREERHERILNTLITTIRLRKKQYRTCQYCSVKFPPEQRFDQKTCQSCASSRYLACH
ncbi:hypothetical protein [Fictibacillus terranigra]|uniref:Uncharacterized protein n=1 Tax=Fictibacillus terranigra TaxID=3058424 RepID=A0ABT8EB80_9BACL|nr:hypothetical protein [Fictibacillus sp. CENA-BCM004]MDN4075132.1 hypothetical protein [Fictibacillus sp. CENA-BCM004]